MVMDAWKHVATYGRILDSFHQCGYFELDVIIGTLHSKLRETIKNREVSYNLVKKVNAFTDEIKQIRDDEVKANDGKELDENELQMNEDLDHREIGSDECDVDIK